MTPPGPPSGISQPFPERACAWIPHTSSLISLAVDLELLAAVQGELSCDRRVLLDVVVDELEELAGGRAEVKALAGTARRQLAWLGAPVVTDELVPDVEWVLDIQAAICGGRPLRHPREHWAESVAIAIAASLTAVRPILLTEDYSARIEARQHGVAAVSVHRLLSDMVRSNRLPADRAALFADKLKKAGRGQEYSADEFQTGRLGRVGHP